MRTSTCSECGARLVYERGCAPMSCPEHRGARRRRMHRRRTRQRGMTPELVTFVDALREFLQLDPIYQTTNILAQRADADLAARTEAGVTRRVA